MVETPYKSSNIVKWTTRFVAMIFGPSNFIWEICTSRLDQANWCLAKNWACQKALKLLIQSKWEGLSPHPNAQTIWNGGPQQNPSHIKYWRAPLITLLLPKTKTVWELFYNIEAPTNHV